MATKLPNEIDVAVGAKIRLQRQVKGFAQKDLAAAIGVTFQQVQKYENGKNRIGSSRLLAIADFLGVTAAFFFSKDDSLVIPHPGLADHEQRMIVDFLATSEGLSLNLAFGKISDAKVRQRVVGLVVALGQDSATA